MRMNPRNCVVPLLIACWLAYALVAGRGSTESPPKAEPESNPPDSGTEVVTQPEVVADEAQTLSPATGLALLELEQGKRQRAAAKNEESRKDLQFAASTVWSNVLVSNWPAFKALREKAAHSPHGQTPCTLCDGRGKMHFCVLCRNSGKCTTCGGTGKAAHNEYCPTCLGKGTCYLCRGSKGMTCPFCDDGTVDVKGPIPPGMMPLN